MRTEHDDRNSVNLNLRFGAALSAKETFHHAETVVQSRLYNYLVIASILVLAWATIAAAKDPPLRVTLLLTLAVLGAALSFVWLVLGFRHRTFLQLAMDIAVDAESRLPEELRVTTQVSRLQDDGEVTVGRKTHRIDALQRFMRSRNIGVIAPAGFLAAFSVMLVASLGT